MNKIKIYQMDPSTPGLDPNGSRYIIRESDYPHLMIRNTPWPDLGPPNTYKGEEYREILHLGRKEVEVIGSWYDYTDKYFLEELTKMEIPYTVTPGAYGERIKIPREYFEVYKWGTY